jgi:hypothetical protein
LFSLFFRARALFGGQAIFERKHLECGLWGKCRGKVWNGMAGYWRFPQISPIIPI